MSENFTELKAIGNIRANYSSKTYRVMSDSVGLCKSKRGASKTKRIKREIIIRYNIGKYVSQHGTGKASRYFNSFPDLKALSEHCLKHLQNKNELKQALKEKRKPSWVL